MQMNDSKIAGICLRLFFRIGTFQEDANALTSWYSGWCNGLAHKHFADFKKGREVEHQVIEYCKAHPDQKIIHAIGVLLKEDRAEA